MLRPILNIVFVLIVAGSILGVAIKNTRLKNMGIGALGLGILIGFPTFCVMLVAMTERATWGEVLDVAFTFCKLGAVVGAVIGFREGKPVT